MNAFLTRLSTAAASAMVVAATASAQSTVDMTGWQTWGGITATANSSTTVNIPAGQTGVSAFAYASLSFEAINGSWCSELRMRVEIPGSTTQFIVLRPTGAPGSPGFYSEAGPGTIAGGAPFTIPAGTTQLKVFVYETFDDEGEATQDAEISSGTLTITYGGPPPCASDFVTAPAATVGATPFDCTSSSLDQIVTTNAAGTTTTTIFHSRVFKFQPTTTGFYTLSACDAGDTKLAIAAACPPAGFNLPSLAYNDDTCGLGSRLNLSNAGLPLTAQLTAGTTYYVVVGGWSADDLPVGSLVIEGGQGPVPPNTCANPVVGTIGVNTVGLDPAGQTLSVSGCGAATAINKPGYVRFVPPATGNYRANTCAAAGGDTVIAAMTTCGDTSTLVACNDDACGLRSEIFFEGTQGTPVFIAVGLYSATLAPPADGFPLTIQPFDGPTDPCDGVPNVVLGSNDVPGRPGAEWVGACFGNSPTYARFVPKQSGTFTASVCSAADDTTMAVMTTCGDGSSEIACDDQNSCAFTGAPTAVTFEATAGQEYFIAIGLYAGQVPASYTLEITTAGPPLDPCAPENIGTAVLGDNTVIPDAQYPALDVTGSPCVFTAAPQAIARAKYLRFTANATGTYLFEQCGDTGINVDARMGLLTTCGDASTFLICDDDGCTGGAAPYTSKFQYDLTAGQVVFLVVGGYNAAATGPFNVEITGPGAGGCQPDLNDDGFVNADDLGILLAQWGPCSNCSADFDQNGFVNGEDLGVLLNAWGACP